ncbi:phosphotransferase family protein [Streptomyces pathocidini]|uniref:Phosphotransferase family protein n=1 Tax=Streptomyces pathocidini TaxID=1650571 RepID=A0ABW7USW6_9ACTN
MVVADRPDSTVVRVGSVISKAHAPDTDPVDLAVRLRVAAHPRLAGVLLPPLPPGLPMPLRDGRSASLWPAGEPVFPDDPDAAPWEEAARLLARLHAVPPAELPGPLPPMRGPAKAARAVARLLMTTPDAQATAKTGTTTKTGAATKTCATTNTGADTNTTTDAPIDTGAATNPAYVPEAAATVLRAWRALPPWARGEAPSPRAALCHGDLHLGQLVRYPAPYGPWLLIDVDDLGLGDPAWDVARPAAWYATGLLAPDLWQRFLDAYRAEGGSAVRPEGDPWPELDVPARALTIQAAALALAKAAAAHRAPDEVEQVLLDACARMTDPPAPTAPDRTT